MKTSESIKELAAALAKAQGEMPNAKKDSTNPHFKSAYADLASIVSAIKEPLARNGLAYVQFPITTERQEVGIATRLMHASGEWVEDSYFVPVSKNDAQGFGSAITYARRYSLAAVCGVAPDDDDGNAAAAAATVRPAPGMDAKTLADFKAAMDGVNEAEKLREITKKALASAGAGTDAFKELRDYAVKRSEQLLKAA